MNATQPNEKIPILAFAKYGQPEHLKELQQGKLFFNHLQYFAGCDESDGRGDHYEEIYKQTRGDGVVIDLKEFYDKSIKVYRHSDGAYTSQFINDKFFANYFCLYSVISKSQLLAQQVQLAKQMNGFGTHVLVIINPFEFIERVNKIIRPLVKNFHNGPVRYINMNELDGRKDYFEKPLKYSYQKEYRLAFENDRKEEKIFDIGNIEDISVLLKAEECKAIEFKVTAAEVTRSMKRIRKELVDSYNRDLIAYTILSSQSQDPVSKNKLEDLETKLLKSKEDLEIFARSLKFLKPK
ncbi:hypothetical protein [Pedobacter panaciterrae]